MLIYCYAIEQDLLKVKKVSRDFRRTTYALDAVTKKTVPIEGSIQGAEGVHKFDMYETHTPKYNNI